MTNPMYLVYLILAFFIILIGGLYLYVKHDIAYLHCEGGAPLLDYIITTPLIFGLAAHFISAATGMNLPSAVIGFAALVVTTITLQIAWWAGTKRKQ